MHFGILQRRTMSVRLFVGNLSYDTTETDLRELFSPIGTLTTVIVPTDRETGKPRGFAFVEFDDPAQAEEATRRLNNKPFKGRTISINEARAKDGRHNAGPTGRLGHSMKPAGIDRGPRSGSAGRHSAGSHDFALELMQSERESRAGKRSRNFGSNAKPARRRKTRNDSGNETGWKKRSIRERVGGQFFGSYEDDLYADDRDLDYTADFHDSDE
jgi:RNA recognition motif-containing protein